MKHKNRSLIRSAGSILLTMLLLAAPMACQFIPCCVQDSGCCDDCPSSATPESTQHQDSDCASGHCLNATMSVVAPQFDEVIFLTAVTTESHWVDEFVPDHSSDPLYRPPITAC